MYNKELLNDLYERIVRTIDISNDMFDEADLAILYHLEPSVHTVFGHECYASPTMPRSHLINAAP